MKPAKESEREVHVLRLRSPDFYETKIWSIGNSMVEKGGALTVWPALKVEPGTIFPRTFSKHSTVSFFASISQSQPAPMRP